MHVIKMSSSLVAYGDSSDSEVEEEAVRNDIQLKSEKAQDVRQLLSVLSAAGKGKKQPVRLGVPSLNHHHPGKGNDSDSDDDNGPTVKRPTKGGGLTSILPPPKQASKIVGKGKVAPQMMVPYTLTKPTKNTTATAKRKKKSLPSKSVKSSNVGEDSDSDGAEPVSFFSHLESTSPDFIPVSDSSSGIGLATSYGDHSSVGLISEIADTAPNAPRPFCVGGKDRGDLYPDPSLFDLPADTEGSRDERYSEPVERKGAEPGVGLGPGLSVTDHAYRRLTGGKRRRGRDPALNDLIEIKEDDVKVGIDTYRKHHSEEVVNNLYKTPEGDKPTGQQKRKHQLTYLAHEAKANELKLLKQWGQSAATKRDTQMKYGF